MTRMVLHQLDDEVATVGPILDPDHTEKNPSYYVPAVGDTATLVIKSSEHKDDSTGKTYDGTLVEDTAKPGQWYATFIVPRGDLPTIGRYFFRARIIDSAGNQQTIVGDDLDVDPGRQAQRASTTTAPVLDLSVAHIIDTTDVHGIADTAALLKSGDGAGGVLSGTYPNPGFAVDMATQAELDALSGTYVALTDSRIANSLGGGATLVAINDFLAVPTPKSKRLIGAFSVAGSIVLPAGVVLDLTEAVLTQTADNTPTILASGAGATILGGAYVGKGTDYVPATNTAPTANAIQITAPDVTVRGGVMTNHAGAGVYVAAARPVLSNQRIKGLGSPTIPSGDAACFGIYMAGGVTGAKIEDPDISDVSIGIIGSIDTVDLALSDVVLRNIAGQHGVYLQTGTGLNITGVTGSTIVNNCVKVQLGTISTADSFGMNIADIVATGCGDTALSINNTASDLSTAKKYYGVTISNVVARSCLRILYLASVRGGTVRGIVGSNSTTDGVTLLDIQDVDINGIVSDGSGRLGVRATTVTGSASRRVTVKNVNIKDPAGANLANNVYGWQINGVTGSDWVDLTIDGLRVSSANANMDYGLFIASGDQESFTLRNATFSGETDNSVRLAAGPRAVKEWRNVTYAIAPLFFPSALPIGGTGLASDYSASAAPTTGTWRRGDRVWNNAPAAAGVPGWVCTAAGTPGTWKAMAALAA